MELKEIFKIIDGLASQFLIEKPYIVGGIPRDVYMNIPNIKTTDVDITTNSNNVLRLGILFADKINVPFDLSDDGHVTVFSDEFDVDFSSHFISSGVKKYLDKKFSGLEEVFSRDFTINTLHQDLITGEIFDPTEMGFDDIKNKIIRTPVPPEITLTDDPRRIYRAINLAARYKFNLDPEIIDFVIDNNDIFSDKNIKDKYISVKINKALKFDEEITLNLLKKLNLFNKIPLNGYFKDVLIKNKLLLEYLNNKSIQKMAVKIAKNWDEYIEQGPEYSLVKEWWENNSNNLPGIYNNSYDSWNKWYMNHYRGDWNYEHKSPQETLIIMKDELKNKNLSKRINKIINILKEPSQQQEEESNNFTFDYIQVKPGVNIQNITPAVKEFIKDVGIKAREIGAEIPVITSGWRSIEEQVKIMANNWINNGGANKGRQYLIKIYGNDYGSKVANVFENYGTTNQALLLVKEIVKNYGSYHILSPGQAVDFRVTDGIRKVLNKVKETGKYNMKIINETNTAAPHYHVSIYNLNNNEY